MFEILLAIIPKASFPYDKPLYKKYEAQIRQNLRNIHETQACGGSKVNMKSYVNKIN